MFNDTAFSLQQAATRDVIPLVPHRCYHTRTDDLATQCGDTVTVVVTQSEGVWVDAAQYYLCTPHGIDFMKLLRVGVVWDWFNPRIHTGYTASVTS